MSVEKETIPESVIDVASPLNITTNTTNDSIINNNNPDMILNSLESYLGQNGEMKSVDVVPEMHKFMKDNVNRLLHKCFLINILNATDSKNVLTKFIHEGDSWNMLNDWLKTAKQRQNGPLLVELLSLFGKLPVSIPLLKTNDTAKIIKQLTKIDWGKTDESEKIRIQANEIVTNWMNLIHSAKTADNDPSKSILSSNNLPRDNSDKNVITKQITVGNPEASVTLSESEKTERRRKTVKPFQAKFRSTGFELEAIKNSSQVSSDAATHSATIPASESTVKSRLSLKRNSDPISTNSFVKKNKLQIDQAVKPFIPSSELPVSTKSTDTNNLTLITVPNPTSIPPPPHPVLVLKESTGFMDALVTAIKPPTINPPRVKNIASSGSKLLPPRNKSVSNSAVLLVSETALGDGILENVVDHSSSTSTSLTDEHHHLCSTVITLDDDPDDISKIKALNNNENAMEIEDLINKDMKDNVGVTEEMLAVNSAFDPAASSANHLNLEGNPKGILAKSRKRKKSTKKIVKWKRDIDLSSFYYFDLDESERGHFIPTSDASNDDDIEEDDSHIKPPPPPLPLNTPPPPPPAESTSPGVEEDDNNNQKRQKDDQHASFARLKKNELALERKAMIQAKKKHLAQMGILLSPWRKPPLVEGFTPLLTDPGMNSRERRVLRFESVSDFEMPLVFLPTIIPTEDASNPLNVMDYRHLQLPSGKTVKKPEVPGTDMLSANTKRNQMTSTIVNMPGTINPLNPNLIGNSINNNMSALANIHNFYPPGNAVMANTSQLPVQQSSAFQNNNIMANNLTGSVIANQALQNQHVQQLSNNPTAFNAVGVGMMQNTAAMANTHINPSTMMFPHNVQSQQSLLMNRFMQFQNVQQKNNQASINYLLQAQKQQQQQLLQQQNQNINRFKRTSSQMQFQMPNPQASEFSKPISNTAKKPCRNFLTPKGCRYGISCTFLHSKDNPS